MNVNKRSLGFFSLLIGLLVGVQNIAMAINCPPGTTPEIEPASLTLLEGDVEGSQKPYLSGGEGIAGTNDGGAIVTDTQGGRVVKLDPLWGAPYGKGHVLAGGGSSEQDNIPATDAQLYYPTAVAVRPNGKILVATRNGANGNSIVREIYPVGDKDHIRTIAGGGHSTSNSHQPAQDVDFGEIQSIVSISESSFLVVSNNTTASVWRVTWTPIANKPNAYAWRAMKIVGDGQSGITLRWASGIDVTRTADGKYQDLLLGGTLDDGTGAIFRFTGDWVSGKGQMSFASQQLSDYVYALVAQPDGSIVFSTYDRIQQVKNAQMPPEIIAGGGTVVPTNASGVYDPLGVQLKQVVNLAPVGKLTVTPGTFLMADRSANQFYMFIPKHEYCNGG